MQAVRSDLRTPADANLALAEALDSAPVSRFHHRAVVISGVGFFTDAYDLFVIGTVASLVATQWHLSTAQTSWVSGAAVLGAFFGAVVLGRLADIVGRKKVYVLVAAIMILGALASAASPNFVFLVVARFVLGLGIGGDYPVSAVLMSEYSNRADRGRLVGMVFSMQALGLIVGPLVALGLVESGVGNQVTWRLLLALGAIPAAGVVLLRSRMPESPRFQAAVLGQHAKAASELAQFSGGVVAADIVAFPADRANGDRTQGAAAAAAPGGVVRARLGLGDLVRNRRLLTLLVGTAGSWFLFDYAYYGNTLSLPAILKGVDPGAGTAAKLVLSLAMFVVFAVPGYALAVWRMDRIGHRRLQLLGFAAMAVAFCLLAAVPVLTSSIGAFVAVFGVSYFFVEFGPNTTTFVLPSEVFPVSARTTGHGIAAGVGKLGAFLGVFLVPTLQSAFGLRGMLGIATVFAVVGLLVTLTLPEAAGRGLEELSAEPEKRADGGSPPGRDQVRHRSLVAS
jgi:MFS family permease